jgi:hypothetical protein
MSNGRRIALVYVDRSFQRTISNTVPSSSLRLFSLHRSADKAAIRRGSGHDFHNLASADQSYQAYNSRARSNAGLARLMMSAAASSSISMRRGLRIDTERLGSSTSDGARRGRRHLK